MNKKTLKNIERLFDLPAGEIEKIIADFHAEMAGGLAGKKSSLKMIPTYVDRPTGEEKGRFIAIDLGGTNFRILELELKGRRRTGAPRIMKFSLKKRHITGTAEEFFDYIAGCLKIFVKRHAAGINGRIDVGFTFSFPVEQTGIAAGSLICWTKGFKVKGVIGNDVVRLLDDALARIGVGNIKISALVNDTVGTLEAKSYEDSACDVGVIIGTGTNACYAEELLKILKWNGPKTSTGRMIVNIEWGNFNKLKPTLYDRQLDKRSANPGSQVMEKMISGMYLGELTRLVLKGSMPLFTGLKLFKSEYVSEIESDTSKRLSKIQALFKKIGLPDATFEDRRDCQAVCKAISRRAARISAACIGAIITHMDCALSRRHTIAIDGSVYERHPNFSKNIKSALRELFGEKAYFIHPVLAKDGSGKGAAIIAAVASRRRGLLLPTSESMI